MVVAVAVFAGCSGDATDEGGASSVPTAAAHDCRPAEAPAVSPSTAPASTFVGEVEVVDGLRFEEVTEAVGLALPAVPPCIPPTCRLNDPALFAAFPDVDPKAGDAVAGAFCQMERFTGGVAVGDVDADLDPDVYVPRLDGSGRLFRNDDGAFTDITAAVGLDVLPEIPTSGAAFADIDRDGDLDLAVNTIVAARPLLFRNDDGRFVEVGEEQGFAPDAPALHAGFSIAVGDYDRDGWPDFYVTEYLGSSAGDAGPPVDGRLLHNRGAAAPGSFTDATAAAGVSIAALGPVYAFGASFADLDADGWPDLSVTGDFATSRLFRNAGDGTFREVTVAAGVGAEENGMGSATGDVDGDGLPDRFVSSVFDARGSSIAKGGNWGATGNRLYRNVGDGTFVDITDAAGVRDGGWGWGSAFVDLTNRGTPDLVQLGGLDLLITDLAAPYLDGAPRLWRNDGAGRFRDVAAAAGFDLRNGRGLAVLDFDGDGLLDLLGASPGAQPRLFRNVSTETGDFLRVIVAPGRDGATALGASVTVRSGDQVVGRQVVGSATDYLGQSETVVHFGLGDVAGGTFSVEVTWPDGDTAALSDVSPNDTIVVAGDAT